MFDPFRETHAAVALSDSRPDTDRPTEPSVRPSVRARVPAARSLASLPLSDTLLPPLSVASTSLAEVALSRVCRRLHGGFADGSDITLRPVKGVDALIGLELLEAVSTVAAGADDLRGVEALLTDVVERVVEETRQLAEGLGLEVVLLVNLLALLHLVLQSVQSGVDGILQIVKTLSCLLLDDVETRREVGGAEGAKSQQKQTGKDAGEEKGGIGLSDPGPDPAETLSPLIEEFLCGILVVGLPRRDGRGILVGDGLLCDGRAEEAQQNDGSTHCDDGAFVGVVPEGGTRVWVVKPINSE